MVCFANFFVRVVAEHHPQQNLNFRHFNKTRILLLLSAAELLTPAMLLTITAVRAFQRMADTDATLTILHEPIFCDFHTTRSACACIV